MNYQYLGNFNIMMPSGTFTSLNKIVNLTYCIALEVSNCSLLCTLKFHKYSIHELSSLALNESIIKQYSYVISR